MLESIFIGLTGLNSYSRGLQMISNNVANLNTPGFKSSSLRFGDLFYRGTTPSGLLGSTGAMQFGTGVGLSGSTLNFRQGDLRSSGGDLDLAIQGRGFLVLMDGNRKVYVRTGQLALDKDGYIADSALGFRLGVLSAGQPQHIGLVGVAADGDQVGRIGPVQGGLIGVDDDDVGRGHAITNHGFDGRTALGAVAHDDGVVAHGVPPTLDSVGLP